MRASRACGICIALLLLSCGGDDKPAPQEPAIDANLELQQGWALFRAGDFEAARLRFERVVEALPEIPDGYVGRGWCQLELDSLEAAALTLDFADRIAEDPDIDAGIALLASLRGDDSLAVEASARVDDPSYVFFGDPTFRYRDLVYIRAVALFHLLRWSECYEALRILDAGLVIDLEAYDFRQRLFDAIEEIGRWV